jgi:uncharacterized membrane protein YbhN (UPF0104 family)
MGERTFYPRSLLTCLVGLVLGAGMLVGIFLYADIEVAALWAMLWDVGPWFFGAITLSTLIHCFITGLKWKLVSTRSESSVDIGIGFYLYSCLIGIMGHFLPLQFAVLVGRSLILRWHGKVPVSKGAAGAVYDQLFDLFIPVAILATLVPCLLGWISLGTALYLTLAVLISAGGAIFLGGEPVARFIVKTLGGLVFREQARANAASSELYRPQVMAGLYVLSLVRYGNLVLRVWVIGLAIGVDVSLGVMVYANSLVTLSLVISFIPGALGLMEWGWISSLQASGLPALEAAQFAISSRALIIASLVLINLLNAAGVFTFRLFGGRILPEHLSQNQGESCNDR